MPKDSRVCVPDLDRPLPSKNISYAATHWDAAAPSRGKGHKTPNATHLILTFVFPTSQCSLSCSKFGSRKQQLVSRVALVSITYVLIFQKPLIVQTLTLPVPGCDVMQHPSIVKAHSQKLSPSSAQVEPWSLSFELRGLGMGMFRSSERHH